VKKALIAVLLVVGVGCSVPKMLSEHAKATKKDFDTYRRSVQPKIPAGATAEEIIIREQAVRALEAAIASHLEQMEKAAD
jgi:hypothetical protein